MYTIATYMDRDGFCSAQRKHVLEETKRIRYVEHADDGRGLFAAPEEAALARVVGKRATAP